MIIINRAKMDRVVERLQNNLWGNFDNALLTSKAFVDIYLNMEEKELLQYFTQEEVDEYYR